MRARGVIDGGAAIVLTALLLAAPVSGAVSRPAWLLVAATAAALGVLVAATALPVDPDGGPAQSPPVAGR